MKENNQIFKCASCQIQKKGTVIKKKVAVNDQEYNFIKGKEYRFCLNCAPKIREYNEYDLLNENPHLWEKYSYADAEEILEKEFGIKPKEEEK